ncbi:PAS domain S-box protein [Patescibacteria group bacterium]|nr:PAS domain S-box protein [Patescibacteria group bacterium]MBU1868761.1 PAS domain S-box protein [Patescibacteria group bacterium]
MVANKRRGAIIPELITEPGEIREKEYRRKTWVMTYVLGVMLAIAAGWSVAEWVVYHRALQSITEFISVVVGVAFLLWQRKVKNRELVGKIFCLLFTVVLLVVNYTYIVSHELSLAASNIFWLFLLVPMAFYFTGWRIGLLVVSVIGSWILFFFFLTQYGILGHPVGYEFLFDFLLAYLVTVVFLFLYERTKDETQSDLQTALGRDRAVLNTIKEGIVVIDSKGKIRVFNHAAERLLGWEREEALMRNMSEVVRFRDSGFFENLPRGASVTNVVEIRTRNGESVYVDLTVSPLPLVTKVGEPGRGVMLTLHDVTEERELERMKLDFVAMAAHELRTPITSIMGYLSVLQDEGAESLSSEQQMFISRALSSSKRLTALMENLLSITRIEKGEVTIQKQPMNWEGFVWEIIGEFRPLAEEKELELIWIVPEMPLPQVMADPLRISEVLNNLLNNAIVYTKQGKITVWCEYNEADSEVVTHVKDTGAGIPKESISHLFEKFYRITGALEEGSKGTGLGLYIAKSIIDMHGGRIWVISELDEGSTFSFSLPVFHTSSPQTS